MACRDITNILLYNVNGREYEQTAANHSLTATS